MKSIFTILFVSCLSVSVAQNVGINTNTPTTTLQVNGTPGTATIADGVTFPKLSGDQLKDKDDVYTAAESGTLVYVTAAASPTTAKTINVTAAGLYHFNGTVWQKVLNSVAFVNDHANTMVKLAAISDGVTARPNGTEFVVKDNGRVGIGTNNPAAPLEVVGKILATDEIQIRRSSEGGQIILQGQNAGTDLDWTIDQINNASNPRFRVFAGTNESNGIAIKENGNLGVGTGEPSQKIAANGNITATGWVRGHAPGQLLNSVFIDNPGGTGNYTSPASPSTGATSWSTAISQTYTPISSNSKILVQYINNSYTIGGNTSGTVDQLQTQLLVYPTSTPSSTPITVNTQTPTLSTYANTHSADFRSGSLFPIAAVYSNTGTAEKTIVIQARRSQGDDTVTVDLSNGTLIIQEIAN